ncbi:MAG TPA: hypothetical protein VF517_05455 [Thermoleophilaceae bacterium]|jgi:hypothetical protein
MSLAPRRHLLIASIALGVSLAAPAAGTAGSYDFGSELSSPANAVEAHGADTVYWDGASAAPDTGQLRYVTIRGGVLPGGGTGDFRFVALHPDGASVKVEQIDQRIRTLPTTTDPLRRVPNKDFNWNLCLHRGDHLGLWKVGHGNLQVFGDVPGSVTSWYENASGLARGDVFAGAASGDRELLMQVSITTGADAFSRCPGGYKDHVYRGLDVARARLSGQALALRARCPRETYGGCFGRLAVRARIGGRTVTLGRARFALPSGRRFDPRIALAPAHAALIRRRGSLRADVVMTGHDDPSDIRNRRAPAPRPGRQSDTGTVRVTIAAG